MLSWIVKYTVEELGDYPLKEIAEFIEGIEIASKPVYPGMVKTEKLEPEEKFENLESDYGVEMTRELREGVKGMCNLGDAIEERGIQQGIQRGIQRGEEQKLIELICRKVRKGKSLEIIAEELEENTDKG